MLRRFERFSFVIGEIHKHLNKISSDEMEKYGLSGPQAKYLVILKRFPGGITASRLADVCDRNKADVSRSMTALEKRGLVVKNDNEVNYRVTLKLTEEGERIAERVSNLAKRAVEFTGRNLTDEHRRILYEALELIASNLQTIINEGIPEDAPSDTEYKEKKHE